MKQIYSHEIITFDNRIQGCIVENPTIDNDEYSVIIWFNYVLDNNIKIHIGRQEFMSSDKDDLLRDLNDFFNTKHNYIIV